MESSSADFCHSPLSSPFYTVSQRSRRCFVLRPFTPPQFSMAGSPKATFLFTGTSPLDFPLAKQRTFTRLRIVLFFPMCGFVLPSVQACTGFKVVHSARPLLNSRPAPGEGEGLKVLLPKVNAFRPLTCAAKPVPFSLALAEQACGLEFFKSRLGIVH